MKYCSKCGKQLGDNDLFCSGCGNNIAQASVEENIQNINQREIRGDSIASKIPLNLLPDEIPLKQCSVAFVESSIAQGILTITNKRILFNKDSAGKAFLKRGGLLGMALSQGANIPSQILLNDISKVESTSCIQSKASFIVTVRSGYSYKIALQSMSFGKTDALCKLRDEIVDMISSVL